MKPICLGQNADGTPIYLTPEMRQTTHMHVIGGSGTGKSKFLEWMIRDDIRNGHGLCLIDWHGTLYKDVLRHCAYFDIGRDNDVREIILINPSKSDFVTGYNPFMNLGDDISVQVTRRIEATIRPWGITDTNHLPTFERVCRLLYTFAVENGQPLQHAAKLLQYDQPELRAYAAEVVSDPYIRDQWRQLLMMKNFRDWRDFALSAENRIGRFVGSKAVKRFMGMSEGNINLREIMDQKKILLINLGSSGFLDREAARVFASLLLNEFYETAMLRANEAEGKEKPATFNLYLDEFQEYITDDVGSMLDQVRKGGLHMILAHQHLGHLSDNARLLESVLVNARIRAVFGGLSYVDACALANEMFLPDLNTRQLKKAYHHTIHLYQEQERVITSHSTSQSSSRSSTQSSGGSVGSGYVTSESTAFSSGMSTTAPSSLSGIGQVEGWFSEGQHHSRSSSSGYSDYYSDSWSEGESVGESRSESEGETVVPVWVPIPARELTNEVEWSREEKVSKVAEMLKTQQQRHCFIKLDTERTQPLRIPPVRDYSLPSEYLLEYERDIYHAQGALPSSEVDKVLEESEAKFLTAAREAIDITPACTEDTEQPQPKIKNGKTSIFSSIKDDPIGRE